MTLGPPDCVSDAQRILFISYFRQSYCEPYGVAPRTIVIVSYFFNIFLFLSASLVDGVVLSDSVVTMFSD